MEESYVPMSLVYFLWYAFNVGWNDDGFIFILILILVVDDDDYDDNNDNVWDDATDWCKWLEWWGIMRIDIWIKIGYILQMSVTDLLTYLMTKEKENSFYIFRIYRIDYVTLRFLSLGC